MSLGPDEVEHVDDMSMDEVIAVKREVFREVVEGHATGLPLLTMEHPEGLDDEVRFWTAAVERKLEYTNNAKAEND